MGTRIDVLVFPMLAQGHIIPSVQLAEALATHRLNVALLTTPSNVLRLRSRADSAGVVLHEIPGPRFPELPEGIDSAEKVPPPLHSKFIQAMETMEPSFREIVARLRPRCLVNDVKPLFVAAVAKQMGVPFFTIVHGVYNVALLLAVARCVPVAPAPFTVPGFAKDVVLRDSDVLRPFRGAEKTQPFVRFFTESEQNLKICQGVIENTVYELEAEFVAHFEKVLEVPVWTVGPLLPAACLRGENSFHASDACLTWLSTQKPGSVLYVCFGSEVVLGRDQLEELSLGLESSCHPFLWVVKPPHGEASADVASLLPPGFLERTRDRGFVLLGWAPQQAILCHTSIGGFLSHCGWNSIMESVSQGVPVLTCPFQLDQPFASKFVVEELRTGVELKREERDGVFMFERSDVEGSVRMLMEGEEREEMKKRADVYKGIVRRAVGEVGSSNRNLVKVVDVIRNL